MAEQTKIQWTDHTFNPWVGCTKVAPGCANCYAEADMDKRRHFALWGPGGTRVRTSDANWKQPLKWNREAVAAGERRRVFCASLADVFEDWQGPVVTAQLPERKTKCDLCGTAGAATIPAHGGQRFAYNSHTKSIRATGRNFDKAPLEGWRWATLSDVRCELFALIDATPNLDWLLLTKRPENIGRMWNGHHRDNVWLGTSISDQATADKAIPELLTCRNLAPVLFLSAEPLVGPIDLTRLQTEHQWPGKAEKSKLNALSGFTYSRRERFVLNGILEEKGESEFVDTENNGKVDWVIIGGESGPNSRACNTEWILSLRRQCEQTAVPCFVKQIGANPRHGGILLGWPKHVQPLPNNAQELLGIRHKKGGDMAEWPEDLRVREFPKVAV